MDNEKRICQWCSKEYFTLSKIKKFCSRSCAASFGNRNFRKDEHYKKLKAKERYQQRKEYHKSYYLLHEEKYIELRKKYNKYNSKWNLKEKERRKTDINYKLKCLLRTRLRSALLGAYKAGSTVSDLGCSIEDFKKYIESKFTIGMSWSNHGLYGWHIDHIKPLTSFDLSDRKQFLEACHYTNLQPLWAKDNMNKSNKVGANGGICTPHRQAGSLPCFS